MFSPRHTITNKLLSNIKGISALVVELNHQHYPHTMLVEFEKDARAISTFASTSIEGNPLPLTDVKKILRSKPVNIQKSEQEVINYNQALTHLNDRLNNKSPIILTLDFILTIQKQVTAKLIPHSYIGNLRVQPVFVNNPRTGETAYLPPDAKEVPKLMDELISFINANKRKIDPLILAGFFHKQFVIIHPFMDGNGRTARLVTKALLADMGLDTFNLFSFENYYNRNVTNYFRQVGVLGNYYDIYKTLDFTMWLEYFTEGIIDELLRVQKELSAKAISPKTELQPYHKKILGFIKEKGYITDRDYAKITDRAKATRILDFAKLIKLRFIKRYGKGRSTYYKLS